MQNIFKEISLTSVRTGQHVARLWEQGRLSHSFRNGVRRHSTVGSCKSKLFFFTKLGTKARLIRLYAKQYSYGRTLGMVLLRSLEKKVLPLRSTA